MGLTFLTLHHFYLIKVFLNISTRFHLNSLEGLILILFMSNRFDLRIILSAVGLKLGIIEVAHTT